MIKRISTSFRFFSLFFKKEKKKIKKKKKKNFDLKFSIHEEKVSEIKKKLKNS